MKHRSKCKRLKGYEAKWCDNLPIVDGDADFDRATYTQKDFDTLAEAYGYAKEVVTRAEWRLVQIHEFEMVAISPRYPDVMDREYIGEVIDYEDGDPVPQSIILLPSAPANESSAPFQHEYRPSAR